MMMYLSASDSGLGKRQQIRSYLLDIIAKGELAPGSLIPSRAELMRQFQCARATVDQVVDTLLQQGVLSSEKGKGTFVFPTAGMASINAVAVVNRGGASGWHVEIEQGILESIGARTTLKRFVYEDLMLPVHWKTCAAHQSVLFLMPDAEHELHLVKARAQSIPHLVVYRDPPESPFVSVDARMAAARLVKVLHERRGCRKFAWFGMTQSRFHFPERRYAGFLESLLECGLPFRRDWVSLETRIDDAAFLAGLFTGPERPDAILVAQKPLSSVLRQLEGLGIRPGKDIVLASFDEIAPGTYPFPVFCLARTTTETGRVAGRYALSLKRGMEPPSPQEYLVPEVIEYV